MFQFFQFFVIFLLLLIFYFYFLKNVSSFLEYFLNSEIYSIFSQILIFKWNFCFLEDDNFRAIYKFLILFVFFCFLGNFSFFPLIFPIFSIFKNFFLFINVLIFFCFLGNVYFLSLIFRISANFFNFFEFPKILYYIKVQYDHKSFQPMWLFDGAI